MMTSLTTCTALAALLYMASGIGIVAAMKRGKDAKASSLLRWPVLLGLLLQAYAIQGEMFQTEAVHFGFGYCVSVMFFFAVAILFVESWVHRIHGQFGVILIAAAVGTLFPAFFPGAPIAASEWTTLFRWHLLAAIAAYSFMMIALVHAVLMALQNRYLKASVEQPKFLDSMPGLVVMEHIFFRIVAVGFLFMTAVLVLGGFATEEAYGVFFRFDHKMILTWIAWVLFGILLAGRRFAGWRAKTALRWFWAGFLVFVIAYLGYSFILEVF